MSRRPDQLNYSYTCPSFVANMKIIIFLTALFCFFDAVAQEKQNVVLTGKLVNFQSNATVVDFSELADLQLPNNDRQIIPDSNGNFKTTFLLKKANYFLLGRNVLWLAPGTRLNMIIDYKAPEKAQFKGSLNEENSYLKMVPTSKAGSYLNGGLNIQPTVQKTIDTVLSLAQQTRYKLYKLSNISIEFRKLEEARINADILNSFNMLGGFFVYKNHIPRDNIGLKKVFKEVDSLTKSTVDTLKPKLISSEFLKIQSFRRIYFKVFDVLNSSKIEMDIIHDWDYAYSLSYEINSTIRKEDLSLLKPKLDSVINPSYREALAKKIESKLQFGDGDQAIDFAALDIKKAPFHLSSLKGKLLVIDLWTTWCQPCLEEMPSFEKLKIQFKDNADVAFIALCVLDNFKKWQQNVSDHNRPGIQLFAEQTQMTPYKVLSIPRTIIIDKNFKIVKMYGPEPSSAQIKADISSILKN